MANKVSTLSFLFTSTLESVPLMTRITENDKRTNESENRIYLKTNNKRTNESKNRIYLNKSKTMCS